MEIVLLGLLAVLLFGAKNLPSIGRSVGRGVRDFRQSVDGTGIKEALDGIDTVRGAVSPTNLARAFVPGVADTQDAVSASKAALLPAGGADAAAAEAAPAPAKPPAVAPPAES